MAQKVTGATPSGPTDTVTFAQLTALQTVVNSKTAMTLLPAGTTAATVPSGTPVGLVAIHQ